MKTQLHSALFLGLFALLASGCFTTTLRSGKTAVPATVEYDGKWHHGVFWGIAELSGPYDLSEVCPQGWAEVTTETSFVNGLLSALTSGLYEPQTVTIKCASGGNSQESEGASDEEDDQETSDTEG